MDKQLDELAHRLVTRLIELDLKMSTAESCTGGWIAKTVTDIVGSSACFDRGFVTYSNESKQELLGVRAETLSVHGAVSEATVREMSQGALTHSRAAVSVAVSGIAGPGGGTPEKPVGTVWLAWAREEGPVIARCERFSGDREAVRRRAVAVALQGLLDLVG